MGIVPHFSNEGADLNKIMESVIAHGDLSKLTPTQKVEWYRQRCEAVGLDYRTQPFLYVTLQGKLTLYATRTATQQLAQKRRISLQTVRTERMDGVYVVTVRGTEPDGRHTEDIGVVTIEGLKGDALANALMKAQTKAQRRVVLSLTGLGMPDESELETMRGAERVLVDSQTGEILETQIATQKALPASASVHLAPTIAPPATPKTEPVKLNPAVIAPKTEPVQSAETPEQIEERKLLGQKLLALCTEVFGGVEKLMGWASEVLKRDINGMRDLAIADRQILVANLNTRLGALKTLDTTPTAPNRDESYDSTEDDEPDPFADDARMEPVSAGGAN